MTPSAAAGSRGAPGVAVGVLVGQGSPTASGESFRGPSSLQDPHWVQTLLPPPRQARKTQTPSPPECGFLPGLGGAPALGSAKVWLSPPRMFPNCLDWPGR